MTNFTGLLSSLGTMSINREVKQWWSRKEVYLGVLAIVATLALAVAAVYYRDALMKVTYITGYSLLGVLVIAFIAGSLMSVTAIPVPYWLVVFTLPSVLAARWGVWAPVWVGVTSAFGCTLGHLPTFIIGYGGSRLSQRVSAMANNRFYARAIAWAQKHGSWAVFATSAVLNPLHLLMTVAIGALRIPPRKWFLFSLLGNTVKSLFIAFAGYFGLSSLLRFLGI